MAPPDKGGTICVTAPETQGKVTSNITGFPLRLFFLSFFINKTVVPYLSGERNFMFYGKWQCQIGKYP